jgi:hypothetical protein
MTQIVKIDPKEFGLEETKAADIAAQFQPMLDKMVALEKEYNEVIKLPIEDQATAIKAKELRLKYVKVRTGTAEIHKTQKAFYLAGGRYVDGWKNAQLFASQGIEEKLESIEKHAENLERERIAKIQAERVEILMQYGVEYIPTLNLGTMPEDVWNNFFIGTKATYEAKKEAEKKAEEERIAKLKAEEEERERIRIENEKLKAEAEAREKAIAEERAKAEAERKALEEKVEAEKKAAEEIARKEREAVEKKLKEEAEAKAKLEAELKAKIDAENKRIADEKARELAELKAKQEAERLANLAPDKDKLKAWVNSMVVNVIGTENMSADSIRVANEIFTKFSAFKTWANEQIDNLK